MFDFERKKAVIAGTAENITCQEVKSYMRDAKFCGQKDVVNKLYANYWRILDDSFSRLCQRLNISPAEHTVRNGSEHGKSLSAACQSFFVDGFPDYVYELLFSDNSPACATINLINRAEKYLKKINNTEALLLLYAKCEPVFEERSRIRQNMEANKLVKCGCPADAEYGAISLHLNSIDGLSFPQWKMLNLPEYTPSKTTFINMINFFEKRGDAEKADFIREKYAAYLKRITPEPLFPTLDLDKALMDFDFLMSPEYRQYLIDCNKREEEKHENDNRAPNIRNS